jgi:hypothetical protein
MSSRTLFDLTEFAIISSVSPRLSNAGITEQHPADSWHVPIADTIQSTGAYKPEELLPEAIGVMQNKISSVEACLRALYPSHAPGYKQTD